MFDHIEAARAEATARSTGSTTATPGGRESSKNLMTGYYEALIMWLRESRIERTLTVTTRIISTTDQAVRQLTTTPITMTFDPENGNAIYASGSVVRGDDVRNFFKITVVNHHIDWITVVCENDDGGQGVNLFDTQPTLNPNDQWDLRVPTPSTAGGRRFKIVRWTSGFLGIPGDGGGQVTFYMPDSGYTSLYVDVDH